MRRRQFIGLLGLGAAGACTNAGNSKNDASTGNESLKRAPVSGHFFPTLPYDYHALEPYIDAATIQLHYDKHHRGYFKNFTAAIENSSLETMAMRDIFADISSHGDNIRNYGGGYYNHNLFWESLSPGETEPSARLLSHIVRNFKSYENFKDAFFNAATQRFGSGWAWLILNSDRKLEVTSTPNQDNPLMDIVEKRGIPLLPVDVWEHAYYLKYQNRRDDYINAFWDVINWKMVSKRLEKALRGEWLG